MKQIKKPIRAQWVIAADILLAGILLIVFALFHHVLPSKLADAPALDYTQEDGGTDWQIPDDKLPTASVLPTAESTPEAQTASATVQPEPTAVPTPTPTPEPDSVGVFANKYADKFITGEPVVSESDGLWSYVSENINVTVTKMRHTAGSDTADVYVADIYLKNIKSLVSGFAKDVYGTGNYEWLTAISERYGAVLSVNGDFYSTRKYGAVIRNGKAYRTKHSNLDACVIYLDGSMRTFDPPAFKAETEVKHGAWQAWNFGPRLLDDNGQPMTDFNSNVGKHNPRTAIGCFEPGHYCFVVVDGRTGNSNGLKLTDLSRFMYDLGCTAAYNLDGGQSSSMAWFDKVISVPDEGGRKISDNVMILDGFGG